MVGCKGGKRETISHLKKKQHGEKQDADDFSAERWVMEALPDIIKDCEPRNVFNADETGLYWRAIPDGTLAF